MNDDKNFLDLFGNMLFGMNNSNEYIKKLFGEHKEVEKDEIINPDDLKTYKDFTSKDFDDYLDTIIKYYDSQYSNTPPEILDMQSQIEEWSKDCVTHNELDTKISNVLGQPKNIRIVEKDGGIYEEKTWGIGNGVLVRHRELTNDEIMGENFKIEDSIFENPIEYIDNFNGDNIHQENIPNVKLKSKSHQEQLDEAIINEDYELACVLRDKLKTNEKREDRK